MKIGDSVYHKECYNYAERCPVRCITESHLLLEWDPSGGTQRVSSAEWLRVSGASKFSRDEQRALELARISDESDSAEVKELKTIVKRLFR